MVSFGMIEFLSSVTNEWVVRKLDSSLSTLVFFKDEYNFNVVQLDIDQDRYLFYDNRPNRYGLCDLRTLSSTATTYKGIRLYQMDQEFIDKWMATVTMANADFGIDISSSTSTESKSRRKEKNRRSQKKVDLVLNSTPSFQAIDDQESEVGSINTDKFTCDIRSFIFVD